jgi:hypothetical protein
MRSERIPVSRVVVIEPDAAMRQRIRPGIAALAQGALVVETVDEAEARCRPGAMVIARSSGEARFGAALACAFELQEGPAQIRLFAIDMGAGEPPPGSEAGAFLREIDRVVAGRELSRLMDAPRSANCPGLAADFPHDLCAPLIRVGQLDCAEIYLVRNRVTGGKELLVQIADDAARAGDVAQALYRNFHGRCRPWTESLRHEITRHHSFISAASLPIELARLAQLPPCDGPRANFNA